MPRERCEWDPVNNRAAGTSGHFGCLNDAVWSIGAKGDWHLCASCARLPRFARYTVRKPLRLKCPNCEGGQLNKLDEWAPEVYYLICDVCEFAVQMTAENAAALAAAAKFVQKEIELDQQEEIEEA